MVSLLPTTPACPFPRLILPTGLDQCFDMAGQNMDCTGSGQDADRPHQHPDQRFSSGPDQPIQDRLTGLYWYPQANSQDFPLSYREVQDAVANMNQDQVFGHTDWRIPTRLELRSLLWHGAKNPALPPGHPFTEVFLGRYWTSTTFAGDPNYQWYVQLEGARVFYEHQDRYCLLWPVCGINPALPSAGQIEVDSWPRPRFTPATDLDAFLDTWTGLMWPSKPLQSPEFCSWEEALERVKILAEHTKLPWRLPDINELESLVDLSQAWPALPSGHPFTVTNEGLWSSTTSYYEPSWAYVLYLGKGAVGVGFKIKPEFVVWPVLDPRS